MLRERSIAMTLICGSLFKLAIKANINMISLIRLPTAQVQPREFVSPIPTNMPVLQPWAFHIIFLILWSSVAIIWLIFRAVVYPNMHVCLSMSDQLLCKIKFVYFWVHLNFRPYFIIFDNLSWTFTFQYTPTNHASGCNLVLGKFPNPDFIVTVK